MITVTQKDRCNIHFAAEYEGQSFDLHYWIIVGGTPALAFSDYSFQCRYEDRKIPGYNEKLKWQEYEPSLDAIGGEDAVKEFLVANAPGFNLRRKRADILRAAMPDMLRSPRFYDPENRCYFRATLEVAGIIHPVTVDSSCYAGRYEDKVLAYGDEKWKKLVRFFNPLFDKLVSRSSMTGWEIASEEQFQVALALLHDAVPVP